MQCDAEPPTAPQTVVPEALSEALSRRNRSGEGHSTNSSHLSRSKGQVHRRRNCGRHCSLQKILLTPRPKGRKTNLETWQRFAALREMFSFVFSRTDHEITNRKTYFLPELHQDSLERPLLYMVVGNDESYGNDFFKANERQRARDGPAYDSR